ncbi:MAG: hypothetical protein IT488_07260 [Gammaproteobacteria bacterium]|nr:hypothetical protein [Gammaproteobacteria bacterium]
MRIVYSISLSMLIAATVLGNAFAAEGAGDLDITIRMMDARQTADEFINRIDLPREFGGTVPASSVGPSNKGPQSGERDTRKRLDGKRNDKERGGNDPKAGPPETARPGAVDTDRSDASGTRDHADESRHRREDFRETARERQESNRRDSHEN